MHLFQPKHFLMPFLAHAMGTLVGAFLTALIAANNYLKWGLVIGIFFFLGGIANVVALPSPIWFNVLDLLVAYLPMAYIGIKLTKQVRSERS